MDRFEAAFAAVVVDAESLGFLAGEIAEHGYQKIRFPVLVQIGDVDVTGAGQATEKFYSPRTLGGVLEEYDLAATLLLRGKVADTGKVEIGLFIFVGVELVDAGFRTCFEFRNWDFGFWPRPRLVAR